ncbi:MAG: hypothetical protein HY319_15920 [Armatimonadetes bacterium]|nr:hypothetical protein [Armatimonadota bacterium]
MSMRVEGTPGEAFSRKMGEIARRLPEADPNSTAAALDEMVRDHPGEPGIQALGLFRAMGKAVPSAGAALYQQGLSLALASTPLTGPAMAAAARLAIEQLAEVDRPMAARAAVLESLGSGDLGLASELLSVAHPRGILQALETSPSGPARAAARHAQSLLGDRIGSDSAWSQEADREIRAALSASLKASECARHYRDGMPQGHDALDAGLHFLTRIQEDHPASPQATVAGLALSIAGADIPRAVQLEVLRLGLQECAEGPTASPGSLARAMVGKSDSKLFGDLMIEAAVQFLRENDPASRTKLELIDLARQHTVLIPDLLSAELEATSRTIPEVARDLIARIPAPRDQTELAASMVARLKDSRSSFRPVFGLWSRLLEGEPALTQETQESLVDIFPGDGPADGPGLAARLSRILERCTPEDSETVRHKGLDYLSSQRPGPESVAAELLDRADQALGAGLVALSSRPTFSGSTTPRVALGLMQALPVRARAVFFRNLLGALEETAPDNWWTDTFRALGRMLEALEPDGTGNVAQAGLPMAAPLEAPELELAGAVAQAGLAAAVSAGEKHPAVAAMEACLELCWPESLGYSVSRSPVAPLLEKLAGDPGALTAIAREALEDIKQRGGPQARSRLLAKLEAHQAEPAQRRLRAAAPQEEPLPTEPLALVKGRSWWGSRIYRAASELPGALAALAGKAGIYGPDGFSPEGMTRAVQELKDTGASFQTPGRIYGWKDASAEDVAQSLTLARPGQVRLWMPGQDGWAMTDLQDLCLALCLYGSLSPERVGQTALVSALRNLTRAGTVFQAERNGRSRNIGTHGALMLLSDADSSYRTLAAGIPHHGSLSLQSTEDALLADYLVDGHGASLLSRPRLAESLKLLWDRKLDLAQGDAVRAYHLLSSKEVPEKVELRSGGGLVMELPTQALEDPQSLGIVLEERTRMLQSLREGAVEGLGEAHWPLLLEGDQTRHAFSERVNLLMKLARLGAAHPEHLYRWSLAQPELPEAVPAMVRLGDALASLKNLSADERDQAFAYQQGLTREPFARALEAGMPIPEARALIELVRQPQDGTTLEQRAAALEGILSVPKLPETRLELMQTYRVMAETDQAGAAAGLEALRKGLMQVDVASSKVSANEVIRVFREELLPPSRQLFTDLLTDRFDVDFALDLVRAVSQDAGQSDLAERIRAFRELKLVGSTGGLGKYSVKKAALEAYRSGADGDAPARARCLQRLQRLTEAAGGRQEGELVEVFTHYGQISGRESLAEFYTDRVAEGWPAGQAFRLTEGMAGETRLYSELGFQDRSGPFDDAEVVLAACQAYQRALPAGNSPEAAAALLKRLADATAGMGPESRRGLFRDCAAEPEVASLLVDLVAAHGEDAKDLVALVLQPVRQLTVKERADAFRALFPSAEGTVTDHSVRQAAYQAFRADVIESGVPPQKSIANLASLSRSIVEHGLSPQTAVEVFEHYGQTLQGTGAADFFVELHRQGFHECAQALTEHLLERKEAGTRLATRIKTFHSLVPGPVGALADYDVLTALMDAYGRSAASRKSKDAVALLKPLVDAALKNKVDPKTAFGAFSRYAEYLAAEPARAELLGDLLAPGFEVDGAMALLEDIGSDSRSAQIPQLGAIWKDPSRSLECKRAAWEAFKAVKHPDVQGAERIQRMWRIAADRQLSDPELVQALQFYRDSAAGKWTGADRYLELIENGSTVARAIEVMQPDEAREPDRAPRGEAQPRTWYAGARHRVDAS